MQGNPFTPTFGKTPEILAGRGGIVQEMKAALSSGGNDPNLCSLFTGPRGMGKTVLLSDLARTAEKNGWIAANVTARSGMQEDIIERALEAIDGLGSNTAPRLTSLSISPLFSLSWEYRDPSSGNWRTRMNSLLDKLDSLNLGLLITVDEVDPSLEELVDFATVYQHFVREDRKVALFMAGLPANVSSLLSDKSASFLRRAAQHQLERIGDHDVRDALRRTLDEAGKEIDGDALDLAVNAIHGFPYLLQLVGFRMFSASGDAAGIDVDMAKRGVELAQGDFSNGVLKKTCQELSDGDLAFLEAMLENHGRDSSVAAIAEHMGKSTSYARVYRSRLTERGIIEPTRRGYVAFAMPFLREYLEDEWF